MRFLRTLLVVLTVGGVAAAVGLAIGYAAQDRYCPLFAGLAHPVQDCFTPDLWTGSFVWTDTRFEGPGAEGFHVAPGTPVDGAPQDHEPGYLTYVRAVAASMVIAGVCGGLAWLSRRRQQPAAASRVR